MNKSIKLIERLEMFGWYEGRNITDQLTESKMIAIFPQNVLDIFYEYGSLKLESNAVFIDGRSFITEKLHFDTSVFFDVKVHTYFLTNLFKGGDRINFAIDSDDSYYYSTLIGKQLFCVANTLTGQGLFADSLGNIYKITDIPELCWVAENIVPALEKILLHNSIDDILILDESKILWKSKATKKKTYYPPLNIELNGNPW